MVTISARKHATVLQQRDIYYNVRNFMPKFDKNFRDRVLTQYLLWYLRLLATMVAAQIMMTSNNTAPATRPTINTATTTHVTSYTSSTLLKHFRANEKHISFQKQPTCVWQRLWCTYNSWIVLLSHMNGERTLNKRWANGERMQKWKSRKFLGLYR